MSSQTFLVAKYGFTVMIVFLGVTIIYSILDKFGIKIPGFVAFGSFGMVAILGIAWMAGKIGGVFF